MRFEPWLRAKLGLISQKSKLAEAIRYALSRWEGLTRFIDDGRIELDNNTVERSIRPIALNRKNALFAGSDGGAEHWATIASLIETCKLNDVDPLAYLTDVLTRIVNGHPNSDIDQLLPWAYPKAKTSKPWPENSAYKFGGGSGFLSIGAMKVIPVVATFNAASKALRNETASLVRAPQAPANQKKGIQGGEVRYGLACCGAGPPSLKRRRHACGQKRAKCRIARLY